MEKIGVSPHFFILVMMTVILQGVASLLFASSVLPNMEEMWEKYDSGKHEEALKDLFLLKQISAEKSFLPEIYFLEAVIAYRAGFWARVVSLKQSYQKRFLKKPTGWSPAQLKTIYFFWVRLVGLTLESYRRYLFQDDPEHLLSLEIKASQPPEGETNSLMRWPFRVDQGGEAEIWVDELDSIVLKELKLLKETLQANPDHYFEIIHTLLQEALQPYHQKVFSKDALYDRMILQLIDLEQDEHPPHAKGEILNLLGTYRDLFESTSDVGLKALLLLRLGILNYKLARQNDAKEQLLSFVKVEHHSSLWRRRALHYLAEIATRQGEYEKAISYFQELLSKDPKSTTYLSLASAYLQYRLGNLQTFLSQDKKGFDHLTSLLKEPWKETPQELFQWQIDLVKRLSPYLASQKWSAGVLKERVGERFFVPALFALSDHHCSAGRDYEAYRVLEPLDSLSLDIETKREAEKRRFQTALSLQDHQKIFHHLETLASFYQNGQKGEKGKERFYLEELLYQSALKAEEYYLLRKTTKNLELIKKVSEFYFRLFGQKGEKSREMLKWSSPYLHLWGFQSASFVPSQHTEVKNGEAVLLAPFEVRVKKRDLGHVWAPPFYFSAQSIPFQGGDSPKHWNARWYARMKNAAKQR